MIYYNKNSNTNVVEISIKVYDNIHDYNIRRYRYISNDIVYFR